jgi:hypothetical protein
LSCPRWAWGKTIRTDGDTGVEKCLSVINPLEMKFNPVAAGFFTSQPLSVRISKFTQKERRFISKSFGKQ